LDIIHVEKFIITIDALGTQTKIAETIIEKKADYCLALKGNQANLYDDVQLYFQSEMVANTKTTREKGHDRSECREYFLETEIDWLYDRERWAGLAAIDAVKASVAVKGKTTVETRYFITSLTNIDDFARSVRAHWGIENQLHWHLDVTFGEDSSRIRNKNAAGVWNVLRKLALEYLKQAHCGNTSIKSRRKLAGWDSSFLERVLFAG
jgi:predicted transposase YbfD/YdcC